MNKEFDIKVYKKYNIDLINFDDNLLIKHFDELGKYQNRIYYEPFIFKKIIYIFSTKYSYYLSLVLQNLLFKENYFSILVEKIDISNDNLYIIPFSQKVNVFPKNYIIYQLEQKDISNWINKKYEQNILNSKITFDYSNSNILKFDNLIKQKIIFFPLPLIPYHYLINNKINYNTSNNILFYGSMNEIRRQKLNYLQQKLGNKYHIKIINNLYGKKLFHEIINSKIIINIHFYKNSILETYRINEVLSCGKIIISEKPNIIDNENYLFYKDKVIFVDNINEMYNEILTNLQKNFKHTFYNIPYHINNFSISDFL
jgi:hypothetical protein